MVVIYLLWAGNFPLVLIKKKLCFVTAPPCADLGGASVPLLFYSIGECERVSVLPAFWGSDSTSSRAAAPLRIFFSRFFGFWSRVFGRRDSLDMVHGARRAPLLLSGADFARSYSNNGMF
jgi:hypothetical protein